MIRIATENDAEELLNIYAPYVEKTAITFEYEVPSVEEFRIRIIVCSFMTTWDIVWLEGFNNAVTNLGDGMIWCGWKNT